MSFSVTDLERSEAFYTDVLGFVRLLDFGEGRVLAHRGTGFMITVTRHPSGSGEVFSELNTGLDHIGLSAGSRDELEEWVLVFQRADVPYTPIQDMTFGHHLNFRDPDNIALEFLAPNAMAIAAFAELRERDMPRDEIDSRVQQMLESS